MSQEQPQTRTAKNRTKNKKGGNWQIILGVLLIIVAVGLLALDPIKNYMIQQGSTQNTVANLTREQIESNLASDVTYDFNDIDTLNAYDVISDNVNPNDLPTIGGISIPDVGMNLPVYKGVSNEGMYLGAGTLDANQAMGVSNYPIASHHSINENLLFAPLTKVEHGDLIYLTDLDQVYVYEIDFIEEVHPTRVDLIAPTDSAIITLITCDYSLDMRIVVQGSLVDQVNIDDASPEMIEAFGLPQTVAS